MTTEIALIDSLKKLAANVNGRLRREHIELIDFDPFLNQLEVQHQLSKGLASTLSSHIKLETFLSHPELEQAVRHAVLERINTLKELCGVDDQWQLEDAKRPRKERCLKEHLQPSQESFRSQVKREALHLAGLETKIGELSLKVEELKGRHHPTPTLGCQGGRCSLRSMWEQLVRLEDEVEDRNATAAEKLDGQERLGTMRRPKSSLLALFYHYYRWQQALTKVMDALRSILRNLKAMKPAECQLFERSFVQSDGSSPQPTSVLTQLLNKRSILSHQQQTGESTDDSHLMEQKQPVYPLRRLRTEKHARPQGCCTVEQCTIF